MQAGLIILFVLILLILVTWKMVSRHTTRQVQPGAKMKDASVNTPGKEPAIEAVKMTGDTWWKKLDNLDQLHLALMLAQRALPVWQNYIATREADYRESAAKPFIKMEGRILQAAFDEMSTASKQGMPPDDHKALTLCYINFIGPVLALQDGNWLPPYPVKKIFLAVYYILKQVVEQNNPASPKNLLSLSINQSIDCLDISRLYTSEEILLFLEPYRAGI